MAGSSAYWLEAEANAEVGFPPRGRLFSRAFAKLLWPFLRHQITVNRSLLGELDVVRERLDRAELRLDRTSGDIESHTAVLVRHEEPLERHEFHLARLQKDVEGFREKFGSISSELRANQEDTEKKFASFFSELRASQKDAEALGKTFETFVIELRACRDLVTKHPEELRRIEQQAFARFHDETSLMRTEFGDIAQLIEERFNESIERFNEFKRLRAALEISVQDSRGRLSAIEMLLGAIRRSLPSPPQASDVQDLPSSMDLLYVGLEETMRGPRELVIERLTGYLSEFESHVSTRPVLDVGCGRAEWLTLLKDAGIESYGVELEMAYVADGQKRGLDVRREDLLTHIRGLKDGSLRAITAFHVVEHLPTELLMEFLNEALRVIEPGGVLILETPNPENLVVAACTFYLDPTHRHPLPPLLLEFFVRSRGFGDVRIEFKNPASLAQIESPVLTSAWYSEVAPIVDTLNQRFFGAQDYAVIAQRN